jgi:membrane protease subunit HflC
MISERKRAAEQFRSEGQGKKAEIEGQVQKELEQIQAEAYSTAQEIKGKADAEATKIYADAFNKDPEFYSFIKTLDTYRDTINKDTTLILTTDNEFYRQLNGAGSPAVGF